MNTTDARDLEILQHSLGLDEYGRGSEYRNRFITSPGSKDWDACRSLAERGLMEDHGKGGPLIGGGHYFSVTRAGREYIREHSPKPPKLTRSQRRYRDFLNADTGLSFREWLDTPYAR